MNVFEFIKTTGDVQLSKEHQNQLWDILITKEQKQVMRPVVIRLGDSNPNGNEYDDDSIDKFILNAGYTLGVNPNDYLEVDLIRQAVKHLVEGMLALKTPDQLFDTLIPGKVQSEV